jgi:hypothetical protein
MEIQVKCNKQYVPFTTCSDAQRDMFSLLCSPYSIDFLQKKTPTQQCCSLVCSVGTVDCIANTVVMWRECHAAFDK